MKLNLGDYVTRISYNNDTIFKIVEINDDVVILKGVDIRLYADSEISDLVLVDYVFVEENVDDFLPNKNMERGEYFYLPAKILHIDGDKDYLNRCLKFYKNANVYAIGEYVLEKNISLVINKLLKKYKPDIVIITGHDSINSSKSKKEYKNSQNFVNAVIKAREYEKCHEKLIIIAGACQSDYESLIMAGANFASSPKRVNIHALDPAIIAINLALTEKNIEIDLIKLLEKTKYGHDGMGGIKSMGLMYVGYNI